MLCHWTISIEKNPPFGLTPSVGCTIPVEFDEVAVLVNISPRTLFMCSTNGFIYIDPVAKRAGIYNNWPRGLFVDAYRLIRQLLIVVLRQMGFSCLHAATVSSNGLGFAFIGNRGAVKTTLVSHLAANYGYDLVSNDKLFVRSDGTAVHIPEAPAVTVETLQSVPNLEERLSPLRASKTKPSDFFFEHPPLPQSGELTAKPPLHKVFFGEAEFALFLRSKGITETSLMGIGRLHSDRRQSCRIEAGRGMFGKCRRQQMCKYGTARKEDPNLAISERQILHSISQTPLVDSAELVLILGEPHATVHRALAGIQVAGSTDQRRSTRQILSRDGDSIGHSIIGKPTLVDTCKPVFVHRS